MTPGLLTVDPLDRPAHGADGDSAGAWPTTAGTYRARFGTTFCGRHYGQKWPIASGQTGLSPLPDRGAILTASGPNS